ncbi:MAG: dTDP-4-dehydrorhamnose reductase [Alicyclobacillus macrosporangiidus]|uniref:dTDP-4-dehydrorhamnose reductase n=1 Tax=Alicyclobacillus macrosporangiidus TaxID=392015 RepID=UPI0026F24E03|nr:dTDP-4-dehydrorhamnose reductase [Alicyclobacillus macrosporangiidus]MCL6598831.1 dTDP-4-dehydrorhamnose reductase [Alicyclobacillus macrosporangiidus]
MRIVVAGANGQLGQDLVRRFSTTHEVHGFGRSELDVTNLGQAMEVLRQVRPDVVINAAAYTAVDRAETEVDHAYAVNAFGARNLAMAAEKFGAKYCYISTDYVFDGQRRTPYREYDPTNPLSVYGKSKRAGEELVTSFSTRYFIIRTSWLYGLYGANFVKTMLKLGKEGKRLTVVDDQIGSPTYTVDLANFLEELIQTDKYGLYHASNAGSCSWYQFAKAIFEEVGIGADLHPCSTEEFPRPAPRPPYSVMDHLSIRINGFKELRPWREALQAFLRELLDQEIERGNADENHTNGT